ncbi:MAG: hypothetical protein WEB29_05180 [Chloroflexota bacterium]
MAETDNALNADLEARIADLERRMPRGERRESLETAFWAVMRNVFPSETRSHMKAAGREQLLAARSYLDHWIAKMEAAHEEEKPAARESIEVE